MTQAARQAWRLIAEQLWSQSTFERFHDTCDALGISPPSLKALLLFERGFEITMKELADELRCDASWVTSLVDALEEKGFVVRQASPQDRRRKIVLLTEEGVLAKKRAAELLEEPPKGFLRLSAADAKKLRDLLERAFHA